MTHSIAPRLEIFSQLDDQRREPLTEDSWAVTLIRSVGNEQAMMFIEGVKHGDYFAKRIYLLKPIELQKVSGITEVFSAYLRSRSSARVVIEDATDCRALCASKSQTWYRPAQTVERMIKTTEEEVGLPIPTPRGFNILRHLPEMRVFMISNPRIRSFYEEDPVKFLEIYSMKTLRPPSIHDMQGDLFQRLTDFMRPQSYWDANAAQYHGDLNLHPIIVRKRVMVAKSMGDGWAFVFDRLRTTEAQMVTIRDDTLRWAVNKLEMVNVSFRDTPHAQYPSHMRLRTSVRSRRPIRPASDQSRLNEHQRTRGKINPPYVPLQNLRA